MSYKINFSLLRESFVLPSVIADKYLKMANEVQIKTILWIFRNSGESVDASQIAKKIGKSSAAVEEALLYWSSVGVLESDVMPESAKAVETVAPPVPKELPEIPSFAPSYEQIVKRCSESPEMEEFFNEIQKILGKTLGYDGQSAFVMMHDSYGLPFEVIFMLVSYCVETGKPAYKYMSKLAQSWGEKEIDTIEKADKAISDMKTCSRVWGEFTRFTGIQNPKPTSKQEEFLLRWTDDYKFTVEMICLAYEIMADNCTRVSFSYMDAVLKSWYEKGIMTPEQADALKEEWKKSRPAKKGKGQEFKSTSYNMDEFKKRADQLPVYKPREGS
ncbi:MAG: DnaD domain protein [Clostridia bacterium]|nr:DnaD domain protein [Clostridia bacterium]